MRRRAFRAVAPTCTAVVLAVLLAGCGGSEEKAPEPPPAAPVSAAELPPNNIEKFKASTILSRARAASKKAGTVRARRTSGTGTNKSTFDARVAADVGMGTLSDRGRIFEIRRVDGMLYYHGDEATAAKSIGEEAAKLLGGRWFVAPQDDKRLETYTSTLTFDTVVSEAFTPTGTVAKGEVKNYLGQPAIRLNDDERNYFIALRGEPVLLGVEYRKLRDKTTYSEWGAPVRVNPPPGDPIRLNKLEAEKPKS